MSIPQLVWSFSDRIHNNRSMLTVLNALKDEAQELRDEIVAEHYGEPAGEDGILGEVCDVINCALDVLRLKYPDYDLAVLEEMLYSRMQQKCEKWERKYG